MLNGKNIESFSLKIPCLPLTLLFHVALEVLVDVKQEKKCTSIIKKKKLLLINVWFCILLVKI